MHSDPIQRTTSKSLVLNSAKMLLLAVIFCFAGCQGKVEVKETQLVSSPPSVVSTPIPSPQKCSSDSLIYEEVLHVKAKEMERLEDLKVQVYTDKSQNLLIKVFELKGDYLAGASGIGNSSLQGLQKNKVVERCELMENEYPEFVIGTYDVSSTYGAEALFVIWCDGYGWNICKAPFQSAVLDDRNKDGVMEIVERYNSEDKKGDVYRFKDGCFERI